MNNTYQEFLNHLFILQDNMVMNGLDGQLKIVLSHEDFTKIVNLSPYREYIASDFRINGSGGPIDIIKGIT